MRYRPWVVVFALISALTLNGALVWQERIPDLEVVEMVELEDEPLRHMTYAPNTRMQNFLEMGMDEELAQRAANTAAGLQTNRKRYRKMLAEQALDVSVAFCPSSSKLPQPYAAMRFLVLQEGERRVVIDGYNQLLNQFEEQAWFEKEGAALPVYNTLERTKRRRQDATVMGVAAVLLSREQEAVNERGPWSTGFLGGGSFATIEAESPAIRQMIAEYFALMHYLTELANEQDGICR